MINYAPRQTGIHVLTPSIAELIPFIDWGAFLFGWDFKDTFENIMKNPLKAPTAQKLIDDAKNLLHTQSHIFTPKALCGVFPSIKHGDDFDLINPEGKTFRFFTLRQQNKKSENPHYLALADFIKPKDFVGIIVSTAGSSETYVAHCKANHDDYAAILAQSVFNHIAEAMMEYAHRELRTKIWGYAPDENLTIPELFEGKYQGIRPAPGYPTQPDHSEKITLFKMLPIEKYIGVRLTESAMMIPEASTCAFCFARPQAHYFTLGKIASDQLADYAQRKGWDAVDIARWSPSL